MTPRGIEAFGEDGLPASLRSNESPSAQAARQTSIESDECPCPSCTRGKGLVEALREALEPFAKIVPSSLYAADGSEVEAYCILLAPINGNPVAFTGRDLARARTALARTKDAE